MVLSSQLGSAEGLSIIIHGLTLLGTEGTSRVVKRAFFQYLLDSVTWSRLRLILIPMIRLRGEGVGKTKQNKTKKKIVFISFAYYYTRVIHNIGY